MKKIYVALIITLTSFHFSCEKLGDFSSAKQKEHASLADSKSETKSDLYYWSGGKKIALTTDSTTAIFLAKDTTAALSMLKNKYRNGIFTKLSSNYFLFKNPERLDLNSIAEISVNAQYSYYISSEQLVPTGEIVLELNEGQDIHDVLDSAKEKLIVLKRSKYNTYLIRIEDNSTVLDVANFIHETGIVKYCLPNFIANFAKNP